MHLPWFKRKGIVFIPSSKIGWFVAFVLIVYAVYRYIDINRRSHSLSDTLINFVFNLIIIAIMYSVVGYFSSRTKNKS